MTTQNRVEEIRARLNEIEPIYLASGTKSLHWQEVYQLRQEEADILRPTEAKPFGEFDNEISQPISAFEIGDLVSWHGVLGKVEKIKSYPNRDRPEYPVYVLLCSYQGGDFNLYKSLLKRSINNGTGRGYLFGVQSNDLCHWTKYSNNA